VPDEEEDEQTASPEKKHVQKEKEPPVKVSKMEQLHQALKAAIEAEDYEKAASLRDEIRKLEMRG
jgi:protein-arginine kinase activator protein McsA